MLTFNLLTCCSEEISTGCLLLVSVLKMLFHPSKCNWMKSNWSLVEDIALRGFLKAAMACWKLHMYHYALNKMQSTDFWCLYLGHRLDYDRNRQSFHHSMYTLHNKQVSGTSGLCTEGFELPVKASELVWKGLVIRFFVFFFLLIEASSKVCSVRMWGYHMKLASASKVSIMRQLARTELIAAFIESLLF